MSRFHVPEVRRPSAPGAARTWQPGMAVQDLQRLPKKGLKMYTHAPRLDATAGTSDAAVAAGSAECAAIADPEQFVTRLKVSDCELANRPAVGLSEWSGTMNSFIQSLKEGVASGIYGTRVEKLLEILSPMESCFVTLNTVDFADAPRSEADLISALRAAIGTSANLLDNEGYEILTELFLRSQMSYLGAYWAMELAMLSAFPEHWAHLLEQAPKIDAASLAKFKREPQRASLLVAVLTKCYLEKVRVPGRISFGSRSGTSSPVPARRSKAQWTPSPKASRRGESPVGQRTPEPDLEETRSETAERPGKRIKGEKETTPDSSSNDIAEALAKLQVEVSDTTLTKRNKSTLQQKFRRILDSAGGAALSREARKLAKMISSSLGE